jgi:hypothetical protein
LTLLHNKQDAHHELALALEGKHILTSTLNIWLTWQPPLVRAVQRSDPSPASFEKALSGLSKKIATTQSRLEWTRLRFRKIKVLGTLYTSFAYLVAVIVLLLVVGYPNLGPMDWTGMAGGPVL